MFPAVSKDALKRMNEEVRAWCVHLRTGTDLADLATWINPVVSGWVNYYGRFYRTMLNALLRRINTCGNPTRRPNHRQAVGRAGLMDRLRREAADVSRRAMHNRIAPAGPGILTRT
jgi:hypothetical protein